MKKPTPSGSLPLRLLAEFVTTWGGQRQGSRGLLLPWCLVWSAGRPFAVTLSLGRLSSLALLRSKTNTDASGGYFILAYLTLFLSLFTFCFFLFLSLSTLHSPILGQNSGFQILPSCLLLRPFRFVTHTYLVRLLARPFSRSIVTPSPLPRRYPSLFFFAPPPPT